MTKIKIADLTVSTIENNRNKKVKVGSKLRLIIPLKEMSNKKFKSTEILENYKKYTNENEKFIRFSNHRGKPAIEIKNIKVDDYFVFYAQEDKTKGLHTTNQLTQLLKDANKLFIKDGHGKVTSQEAFEFLQSIIESKEIKSQVKFNQGDEITLGE
ncbi:6000_t:CDS:2 [Funneliformis geosporum]|uniref:6000_t:CDS:1 n=1 Tax=Funneliformis geosporum TaxID=1117311 RepID=A0A9W4XB90_9GLOM|nr:6000_t:CDS:2 [Funneliformis geosporum]